MSPANLLHPWLAALIVASALIGCDDGPSSGEPVDGGPLPDAALPDAALPDGPPATPDAALPDAAPPTPAADYWTPDPLERPACGAGRFTVGAICSAPWPCPEGWLRDANDIGCRPPPLPDCPVGEPLPDGTCLDPWPCPDGWSRTGGPCLPAPIDCPDGVAVAGRCVADGCFAAGPALHVDPAADPGGAGSDERPFIDLQTALAAAAPGATLALAAGRYGWPDDPPAGDVTVRGRCGAAVTVLGARIVGGAWTFGGLELRGRDGGPALAVEGGAVTLRQVRVGGFGGVTVDGGAARLEAVLLSDLDGGLTVAPGAEATLRGVRFERTAGIQVRGALDGEDVVLLDSDVRAVGAYDGGRLRLRRVVLRSDARAAIGLLAQRGSALDATDVTVIDARDAAVLVNIDSAAEITRLQLAGHRFGPSPAEAAIAALDGSTLTLTDALIEGAEGKAIETDGAVRLAGVVIRDTAAAPVGAAFDLFVRAGGQLVGERVAWRRQARAALIGIGALADSGARIELRTVNGAGPYSTLAGTTRGALSLTDAALHLTEGGAALDGGWLRPATEPPAMPVSLSARRVHVTGAGVGFGVLACRAAVEIEDAVFEDLGSAVDAHGGAARLTRLVGADLDGPGIALGTLDREPTCGQTRAAAPDGLDTATLDRLALARATGSAVLLRGPLSATARDVRVRGFGAPDRSRGLEVIDGALDLERAGVRDVGEAGVRVYGPDAVLTARDVVIESLWGGPPAVGSDDVDGLGLLVRAGAADVQRLRIERAYGSAAGVFGGALIGSDVTLADTRGDAEGRHGAGLSAFAGATVDLTRLAVRDNRAIGVSVSASTLRLTDAHIADTAPDTLFERPSRGFGLLADDGATVDLTGVTLRGNHSAGLMALSATVDGERVRMSETAALEGVGHGLYAWPGARVALRDFALVDNAGFGASVTAASAHLARGEISGNTVGLRWRLGAQITLSAVRFADNPGGDQICEDGCAPPPPPVDDP